MIASRQEIDSTPAYNVLLWLQQVMFRHPDAYFDEKYNERVIDQCPLGEAPRWGWLAIAGEGGHVKKRDDYDKVIELGHIALEWSDVEHIDYRYYEIQADMRVFMRHIPGPKAADKTIVERYLDDNEIEELYGLLVDADVLD